MSMLILAKVLGSDCCLSNILRGVMQTCAVMLDDDGRTFDDDPGLLWAGAVTTPLLAFPGTVVDVCLRK